MPVVDEAVANPYTQQLGEFNQGIGNARRGLIDLYKLRRRNIGKEWRGLSKMYADSYNLNQAQYGSSTKALAAGATNATNAAKASGWNLDDAETARAVAAIVRQGSQPYAQFLGAERKAQGQWFKDYKTGELRETNALLTGLKREQPAALSELEQGIVDTQSNLQTQASAFAQQQAYNNSMQAFQNQMLGFQRQLALGASGMGGGGGGTGKETPNTAQWMQYAQQRWGVTVGGWRAHGSVPNSDHPKGRAIDIMSSGGLASSIANDFVSQAGSRGVSYVIWNHNIWTPARGWHRYSGPNPHTDHVHVSFAY
jgi:hypothetical protein